jgi:hypothetical protein
MATMSCGAGGGMRLLDGGTARRHLDATELRAAGGRLRAVGAHLSRALGPDRTTAAAHVGQPEPSEAAGLTPAELEHFRTQGYLVIRAAAPLAVGGKVLIKCAPPSTRAHICLRPRLRAVAEHTPTEVRT